MAKLFLFGLTPATAIQRKNELASWWNRRKEVGMSPRILEKLICQRCREPRLEFVSEAIECRACGARYEQTRGVFDFDA